MVARPSLKRVVPGSVPPWRALCAASARALKAFFSILCISCKFLNLFCWDARRPTCWPTPSQAGGQPPGVADAAGQPAVPAQPHERSLGALPLPLGPCGCHGSVPPARAYFFGLDPGCRAMFFVAAPWFSTSGNQKSGGRSLSEHFRDRNALGFARRRTSKLVGRAATQLNANLKSSPSR